MIGGTPGCVLPGGGGYASFVAGAETESAASRLESGPGEEYVG